MNLAIFLGTFVFLTFCTGMPIALTMMIPTVIYALLADIEVGFLAIELFGALDTFVLLSIPLFIMTAEVMNDGSLSDRMFRFAGNLVGSTPGGLGHVSVISSIIFSGMSGAAVADVGGTGRLCIDAMRKRGFDERFSVGLNVASACIGPIIPPSIPMVILAMVTDISIGKLFLGGIGPGLLMGLSLMGYVYYVSVKRNFPRENPFHFPEFLESFKRAFLTLLTPVILLGGIYGGFFTVTEAACVAVVYATILSVFVYRLLGARKLFDVFCRVFSSTGPILLIFPAAKLFGYILTVENLPDLFASSVLEFTTTPWVIILLINILFLVLGLFADPNINIMLFVPIVLPLAHSIGMDPVHFGVMVVLNAMIGLTTPPVGQLLFAVSSFTKCSFEEIVKGVIPFTIILLADLFIIIVVPGLVTWLPNFVNL